MKRILLLSALSALFIVSCNKESQEVPASQPEGHATFKAYILEKELTKTTYLNETTFNWVGNEIVSMDLIKNSDNANDRYDFYIPALDESDKTAATFESAGNLSVGQGSGYTYRLGARAYYPGQKNLSGYPVFQIGTAIKSSVSASTVTISETFKPCVAYPMQVIPMIGNNDGNDNFAFHTATGILKITVSNIDDRLAKVQLYSEGQQLSGVFNISSVNESGTDYECYVIGESDSDNTISLQYSDRSTETELPFYFPVPVGTLNANFQIRLLDADDNVLRKVKCPTAVPIVRNQISEMTKAIEMPATDYSATVTPGGTSAAVEANVVITKDATSVKVVLASSESGGISLIESDDASVVTFANGETKALPMTNITTSGTAYVVAKTYSGTTAKLSSAVAVYALSEADASSILSQYHRDLTVGSLTSYVGDVDLYGDNTITLEASNDITKGNVMITEFCGFRYDIANSTFSTYGYDFSTFTAGDPVYGIYGDNIKYDNKTGAEFRNLTSQIFYYDASSSKHILATEQGAATYLRFAFNSTGYSSIAHDLVVWDPYIGNNYDASLTSHDFYFNKYVANKTKGRIALTDSMISVSSNCSDNTYGDAGGVAALVDKNASTYWHSDYFAAPTLDADYGIYMQIDLGASKAVSDFTIIFKTRSDITHGLPTKYKVGVSNDGVNFTDLTGEVTITATAGAWFSTQKIATGGAYRYIRFGITESDKGTLTSDSSTDKYTHLAELQLWEN